MTQIWIGVKTLAMAASFAGLCGVVRQRMKLSGTAAPLVAACLVIVVLMLGGMAGALMWTWWALFAGGLAGLAWRRFARGRRADRLAVAALVTFFAFAALHLGRAYVTGRDTVSHWALAAKYLLRTNRFPDDSTQLIYFQTYPLGTAVFLYYAGYLFGPSEAVYMIAQAMLGAMAFLPVFGLVRSRKALGWTLAAGVFACLLAFNVPMTSLQVDSLMPFMAMGGVAIAAQYWRRPQRGLGALLPVMGALMFIKHSGAFFCAIIAGTLLASVRENRERLGARLGKRPALRCAGLSAAAVVLPFALWEAHARAAFSASTGSKHAVSLEYYAQTATEKSGALVRRVAVDMLRRLAHPPMSHVLALAFAALAFAVCLPAILRLGAGRARWLRRLRNAVVACAAIYAVWYALLFFMYVFSMTPEEARELASIGRYERSAIACALGGATIFALALFCGKAMADRRGRRRAWGALGVLAGGMVVLVFLGGGSPRKSAVGELLRAPSSRPEEFRPILDLRDVCGVPPEKSYLLFTRHDEFMLHTALYAAKYEFYSNDIMLVSGGIGRDGYDRGAYYTFRNLRAHHADIEKADSLSAVLETCADQYDYVLACVWDPAFEAALDAYAQAGGGRAKVVYAYDRRTGGPLNKE